MTVTQDINENEGPFKKNPPTLSKIISNLGIICINTSTFLWRVLNQFEIVPENGAEIFTPGEVCKTIQEIFSQNERDTDDDAAEYIAVMSMVLDQGNLGLQLSADSYGEREAKVLADAINETNPAFDWVELFSNIEEVVINDPRRDAGTFFGIFLKTAFEENVSKFPTQCLYTRWKSRVFQFYTIKTIIQEAPELIIDTSQSQRLVLQPKIISSIPLHVANSLRKNPYNSLDLIEALITFLQDSLYSEVKELMEWGIRHRPELILLGLTESKVPWNALYRELTPGLVLLFVTGHPSSSYVLPILWQSNKTLVATGLMHLYSKSPAYTQRILEIAQELKALDELLSMRSCGFSINLAIAASGVNLLDIDKWLQIRLSEERNDFLMNCISFLEERLIPSAKKKRDPVKSQETTQETRAASYVESSNQSEKAIVKPFADMDSDSDSKTQPILSDVYVKLLRFLASNYYGMPQTVLSSFKDLNSKLEAAHPQLASSISPLLPQESPEPPAEPQEERGGYSNSGIADKGISYFEELYKGEISLKQMVNLLEGFSTSSSKADRDTYNHMIQHLLNEYKFINCYPDKQLTTTAALYGCLIDLQILDKDLLQAALNNVLDALRQPPDSRCFHFGLCALSLFNNRLKEWRQYSEQLLSIPGIQQYISDIPSIKGNSQSSNKKLDGQPEEGNVGQYVDSRDVADIKSSSTAPDNQNVPTLTNCLAPEDANTSKHDAVSHSEEKDNKHQELPPENVRSSVLFILNNVSTTNMMEKVAQLKKYLNEPTKIWLSHYIVSMRVCFEPNLSDLYVTFLNNIGDKQLDDYILSSTYKVIYDIIGVNKTDYTLQERHSLKNLGSWLGYIALAKNKPIKHKDISFKDLIMHSCKNKTLSAIVPFVCKTFEHVGKSSVFCPPNPWTMDIFKILAELYHYSQMKTNLKLQVEIMFKNLNLEISEIECSNIYRTLQKKKEADAAVVCSSPVDPGLFPTRDNTYHVIQQSFTSEEGSSQQLNNAAAGITWDYTVPHGCRKLSSAVAGSSPDEKQWAAQCGTTSGAMSLPGMRPIDSPYFLRKIVQVGVESAIREVITAVVERSVAIAGIATRELVLKDFNLDIFEDRMTKASHIMASTLAGSLASVSSREPLRISIMSHVRVLLSLSGYTDQSVPDQIIHQMVSERLDYACSIMENAASERAIYEVDEAMSSILARRKQQRQDGSKPYNDGKYGTFNQGTELPPMLRLRPEGMTALQWKAYEDFTWISKIPGACAQAKETIQDPPRVKDIGYQQSTHAPNSQQIIGQILEEFMKYANELEKLIVEHSATSGGKIPVPDEIANIFRGIQYLVMVSHRLDLCVFFTRKILQLLYKHHHLQTAQEVLISLITWFCRVSITCVNELSEWFLYRDDDRKYNPVVAMCLLQGYLINPVELDAQMARMILCGNQVVINFSVEVLYLFLMKAFPNGVYSTFLQTFDTLRKLHDRKQTPARFDSILDINTERAFTSLLKKPILRDVNGYMEIHSGMAQMFMNWVAVYYHPYSSEVSHNYFVKNLYMSVPPSDFNIMNLFTACTHLTMDTEKFSRFAPAKFSHLSNYQTVDAFARLAALLIRHDYFKQRMIPGYQYNANLFTNALVSIVIIISLFHKVEETKFKQRPILRLFSSILNDIAFYTGKLPIYPTLLAAMGDIFNSFKPSLFPAMTFAWIQIISHRNFMPRILSVKEHWGCFHTLLVDLLTTMTTLMNIQGISEKTRYVYKGVVHIIMAILNDFPEFLCGYHISLVSYIPHSCIYLRNLILSASPRNVEFPDPFTPNLKVDLLPEIEQSPQIYSDYVRQLSRIGILEELNVYLNTRSPLIFLAKLKKSLMYQTQNDQTKYNIPAINSLVLYVGVKAVSQMQEILPQNSIPLIHSPTLDIYQHLIADLDAEGRYYLLSALADQLRYPNRHTHYFSCVILYLFAEATQELVQEQITRVLVERAIVSKPHPYGLLITYVELIRNKRYKFWEHKSFLTCSPDIEEMFLAVKKSINQLLVHTT